MMLDKVDRVTQIFCSLVSTKTQPTSDCIEQAFRIHDEILNQCSDKAINVPHWNSYIAYDKPTYVYYEGKVCVITSGLSKPVEIPQ